MYVSRLKGSAKLSEGPCVLSILVVNFMPLAVVSCIFPPTAYILFSSEATTCSRQMCQHMKFCHKEVGKKEQKKEKKA